MSLQDWVDMVGGEPYMCDLAYDAKRAAFAHLAAVHRAEPPPALAVWFWGPGTRFQSSPLLLAHALVSVAAVPLALRASMPGLALAAGAAAWLFGVAAHERIRGHVRASDAWNHFHHIVMVNRADPLEDEVSGMRHGKQRCEQGIRPTELDFQQGDRLLAAWMSAQKKHWSSQ